MEGDLKAFLAVLAALKQPPITETEGKKKKPRWDKGSGVDNIIMGDNTLIMGDNIEVRHEEDTRDRRR